MRCDSLGDGPYCWPVTRPRIRWWWLAILLVVVGAGVGGVVIVRGRTPGPSVEAFCERMTAAEALDDSLATLDPKAIDGQLRALRDALAAAPAEVTPDLATVVVFADEVVKVVAANRTDTAAAVEQALRDRQAQIPAVTEAGRRVEAYTATTCGIELGISGSRPA